MKTVYSLHRIEVKKNQRYPKRQLDWRFIGYFSSLEKVEKAVREDVAQEKREERWQEREAKKEGERYVKSNSTFGYQAERVCLDMGIYEYSISWHIYTREGILYEECFICDENDPEEDVPFYGRPEEKIRFKVGDIVEVVCGHDFSELGIVVATPYTPERYKELEERCIRSGRSCLNRVLLDFADDCYLTYSLGAGDTHDHPLACHVLEPTMKVSEKLKHKLRAKLISMSIAYGHELPKDFIQQYTKDPKMVDEVLDDFEKIPKHSSIRIPVAYDTEPNRVKAVLLLSPEQAERYERIYKASLRIAAEEQEKAEKEREKEQSY